MWQRSTAHTVISRGAMRSRSTPASRRAATGRRGTRRRSPRRSRPAPAPRSPASTAIAATALVLGLIGLVISVIGVATELMPRTFTAGQQRQITDWEYGRSWRTLPAGQIFPASVGYQAPAVLDDSSLTLTARRIGIARQSGCQAATDPAAAAMLARNGCSAMLRATYADGTDSYVVTVGVAVLPSTAQAEAAERGAVRRRPGRGDPARRGRAGLQGHPGGLVHRPAPAALRVRPGGHLRGALHGRLRRQQAEGAGRRRQLRRRGDDDHGQRRGPGGAGQGRRAACRRRTARGRPDAEPSGRLGPRGSRASRWPGRSGSRRRCPPPRPRPTRSGTSSSGCSTCSTCRPPGRSARAPTSPSRSSTAA